MKITASLSSRICAGKAEILLRVSIGRNGQYRIKSHLYIRPDRFRDGRIVIPRYQTPEQAELIAQQDRLNRLSAMLMDSISVKIPTSSHDLQQIVERYHNPDAVTHAPFWAAWDEWESQTKVSEARRRRYKVVRGDLMRYEEYRHEPLTLDMTSTDILGIERYLRDEHLYNKSVRQRGGNVISSIMSVIRTYCNWCVKTGKMVRSPFADYTMPREIYGTPYYLTIAERDTIAAHDYSPAMNQQRDVFIFQCHTGCRVGDLLRLTADNIVDGCLEYTPHKTMGVTGNVVRVPLTDTAMAIVERYRGGEKLLPVISAQRYNDAIKALMVFAGIDRKVTVLNPISRQEERKPLYEVASSHLARRTFIGNLYRQVQDPNLIGSMSGHADGSKAFSRYRTIDEDIKRRAIELIR